MIDGLLGGHFSLQSANILQRKHDTSFALIGQEKVLFYELFRHLNTN
jgi:hypothetical protein